MWLARDRSGFPWSPVTAVNLQLSPFCALLSCPDLLYPLSVCVMVPPGLVHPSGCWSDFLCGFNPYFYLLVLLIPACRCLGLWWQLLKTESKGARLCSFLFIDLPPDSTTYLLLSGKNNSQESCLPLVPVQVFNSVLVVLREGNIRKPL